MSGPKVVRVVTRDELVAESTELLRQLDSAIATWEREVKRFGTLADRNIAPFTKTRGEIARCIEADKFNEVRQRVPAEIEFLNRDIDKKRLIAIDAAVQAMQQSRQLRENAAVLLTELQRRKQDVGDDIKQKLQAVARGTIAGEEANSILGGAYQLLSGEEVAPELTDAQRTLIEKLKHQDVASKNEKWVSSQNRPEDTRVQSIDRQLSELSSYLGEKAIAGFAERVRRIEERLPGAEVNMHIDALVLDLAAAVQATKTEVTLLREASELAVHPDLTKAETESIESDCRAKLEAAIRDKDIKVLSQVIPAGRQAIADIQRRRSSDARRRVILSGLSALGYEIREGMSTAWVAKGRIVVHKPNLPGYGVELAGGEDAERLQVRAVAFSDARDTRRDKDIETIWCGDFEKLRGIVSTQGSSIVIDKALAIGATPLKVVEALDLGYEDHISAQAARTK
jgi:predicted transcriptional regulator